MSCLIAVVGPQTVVAQLRIYVPLLDVYFWQHSTVFSLLKGNWMVLVEYVRFGAIYLLVVGQVCAACS